MSFRWNMGTVQSLETIISAAEILRFDKSIRFVMVGGGSRLEWGRKLEIELMKIRKCAVDPHVSPWR